VRRNKVGDDTRQETAMIQGRCECAAIRYELTDDIIDLSHCHCSQCRRLQGAPYVSFAGVAEKQIHWKCGRDELKVYASSARNGRYFCPHCGAHIMVISRDEPGVVYLTMGCVEGDPKLPTGSHQFVGSKAPWVEIHDDLPQFLGSADD
jgi:hypothetical protein